ncbi:hypothetical protein BJ875DRAFT_386737 [Amylocarpus encephaloides]|uniref:Uncharacterized protein n=1 Tax=Amylocarpus encephaloides TaxID=45428 RepID=A0A9P8C1A6_9HELO|nr:hypothetical protein BJ875DRAFT_386737 [Amylocarpus encephaloides]
MPRPKRSKVAPSAPAPRVPKVPGDSITTNMESREPKSASSDIYDVSDPDERAVESARRIQPGHGRGRTDATLVSANSNHAIEEDISSDDASQDIEVGRRGRNTPGLRNSAIKLATLKRRSRQPSLLGRGLVPDRSSSVESDLAEDSGLTNFGKNNTNAIPFDEVPDKPRRPIVTGYRGTGLVRSSMGIGIERSTPALKLGNFKRRAREPSLLGTAQKPRLPRADYLDEDEEEFNPDDESTPLNLSKTKAMASSSEDEVDTSGLAPDDDELSHLDIRARRRQRTASRTPAPVRRGPKPKAKAPLTTKSAAKRTYGTHPNLASDKENEGGDGFNDGLGLSPNVGDESPEDSQELEARIGKELKKATRKFQEVDKWELDFEEATASSSSPKDTR